MKDYLEENCEELEELERLVINSLNGISPVEIEVEEEEILTNNFDNIGI